MKAVVYRDKGRVQVESVPIPEVAAGEILVRIEASGLCGTDLKKIEKGLLPGPRIFGHEMAGLITATGPGVRALREGQRVVLHHHVPCGDCYFCRRRAYAQCPGYKRNGTTAGFEPSGGGYSQYVKAMDWIVARGVIPVPDGVLPEEAAFVEPVNTCLKAVRVAGVTEGESVLVAGQGPIGLLLMQLARWSGALVVVSDPLPERRAMSSRLGAETVLEPSEDLIPEIRRRTEQRGVDCALVAAPGPAAFAQAVEATRPGGRILVFSATAPGETAVVDLGRHAALEKQILFAYSADVDLQDLAARLVFERVVKVRELVSHRFPIDAAPAAFALAARPTPDAFKVMLEPHAAAGAGA